MRIQALLTICLVASLGSAAPQKNAQVTNDVRKLFAASSDAVKSRDRAALEQIFADEFLFVHADGRVDDKGTWIGTLLSQKKSDKSSDSAGSTVPLEDVQIYGDVAVLRMRDAKNLGTTICAKKGGKWRIVQIQSTSLVPPEAARGVPVDPNILKSYAGRYHLGKGVATITTDGNSLFVQVGDKRRVPLAASSDTQFIVGNGSGAEITFSRDELGNVTRFIHRLAGRETQWEKSSE